jgi:hypothetical protein
MGLAEMRVGSHNGRHAPGLNRMKSPVSTPSSLLECCDPAATGGIRAAVAAVRAGSSDKRFPSISLRAVWRGYFEASPCDVLHEREHGVELLTQDLRQ